jgi:hypothetical protein
MKIWELIVIVILSIATVVVWTLATAALYRKGRCITYPYYWCDSNWKCCSSGNSNENCADAGGSGTQGSYKITDKFYGSNNKGTSLGDEDHNQYYDLCIAPANAYIAANPGKNVNCLYTNNQTCAGTVPTPYTDELYNPTGSGLGSITGFLGRCYYYNVDDAPGTNNSVDRYNPNAVPTYNYLPGYSDGSNTPNYGNLYAAAPSLNNTYSSGYYFAGNSGPETNADTTKYNWANGPNQADSTFYSAWNRLGNPTSGVTP